MSIRVLLFIPLAIVTQLASTSFAADAAPKAEPAAQAAPDAGKAKPKRHDHTADKGAGPGTTAGTGNPDNKAPARKPLHDHQKMHK